MEQVGFGFWVRWVLANGLGELVGLGLVAAGTWLFAVDALESGQTVPTLTAAAFVVVLGAVEGAVVGIAQWSVLKLRVRVAPGSWIGATAIGAIIAWLLGMVPSTLVALGAPNEVAAPPEPSMGLILAMAGMMGLVLGVILALPQWLVLRRALPDAGWWIPANSAAWLVGMPVIFLGVGLLGEDSAAGTVVAVVAATLGLAGSLVGAVHGMVLIRLINRSRY